MGDTIWFTFNPKDPLFPTEFGETLHNAVPFVKNISNKGNLKIIFLQWLNGAQEECYNARLFTLMWGWGTLCLSKLLNSGKRNANECIFSLTEAHLQKRGRSFKETLD